MKQYKDMIEHILQNGSQRGDRTGTGTISTFGYQNRYDLSKGFPLMTLKEVKFENIAYELLWFLNGDTNIKYLNDNNVHIWNPDAFRVYKEVTNDEELTYKEFTHKIKTDEDFAHLFGDMGPIYGRQWREWESHSWGETITIDQITNVIKQIKEDPNSRRMIVSAWNPGQLDQMGLPPCHTLFQFYVDNGKLSLQLYQRSADSFLGVPYNIASYALLVHMVAQVTGLEVGEFIHTFGDLHLYNNHYEQAMEILSREPKELPVLAINREVKDIFSFKIEDFALLNYNPHPKLQGKVSVG